MTKYKLFNADCIDLLSKATKNSVHAIVTDPPYGLAFMGKTWDDFEPKELQEFTEKWASECLRVLKPGGHLLSFGGTRTFHRIASGIEDAGFEIRDCLSWNYGCLDEETEIRTLDGWKTYHELSDDDWVLSFDKDGDYYEWQPIQRTVAYDYEDTAYRIKGDHTDQLVSKDHRVLIEREGDWVFQRAQHLAREQEIRIPTLEGVPRVSSYFSGDDKGTSQSKQDMLERVCGEKGVEKENRTNNVDGRQESHKSGMCNLRGKFLQTNLSFETVGKSLLFTGMQRGSKRRGVEKTCPQRQSKLDRRKRTEAQGKNDWRDKSRMEGRCDREKKEGQLQARKNGQMPRRILRNGKIKWLRSRTPSKGCKGPRSGAEFRRSRTSHGPRQPQQRPRKSRFVQEQPPAQTVRTSRRTETSVARIETQEYSGLMWCVKVPSGAFVARRKGKVFVTGNSGFPKSHNISKAIDKMKGAKREVVGKRKHPTLKDTDKTEEQANAVHGDNEWKREWDITAPDTEEAKKWDGYGTALKPSWEPIILARAPLSEDTIADNVLKHGTGALNIRECEIGTNVDTAVEGGPNREGIYGEQQEGRVRGSKTGGRFPANTVLSHTKYCIEEDGEWDCPPSCPVRMLDEDSGYSESTTKNTSGGFKDEDNVYGGGQRVENVTGANDSGGASRFFYTSKASSSEREMGMDGERCSHPTVKPLDLMRWLITLVTPVQDKSYVLDPFMGSGTTGIAVAQLRGKTDSDIRFLGIEREEEYFEMCQQRIQWAFEQDWERHFSLEDWQEVNGVGAKTAEDLYDKLGAIQEADLDNLEEVNGVGPKTAETIRELSKNG